MNISLQLPEKLFDTIIPVAIKAGWQLIKKQVHEAVLHYGNIEKNLIFSFIQNLQPDWTILAIGSIAIPQQAVLNSDILLEGQTGASHCPYQTTVVAGELLLDHECNYDKLYSQILENFDWWLKMRASCQELAIAWKVAPPKNILFLFNQMDAGYLTESCMQAIVAKRVKSLYGWHPLTKLIGMVASIEYFGVQSQENIQLIALKSLQINRFWNLLKELNEIESH